MQQCYDIPNFQFSYFQKCQILQESISLQDSNRTIFVVRPYWAAILLRSRGFSVSPEQIARSAGSVLPIGESSTWLPKGARSRQDYELSLPETKHPRDAGTSAQGLIDAVASTSQGTYCLLPLQAHWSAERVETVLNFCQTRADWQMVPLCNIRTDHLWGTQLSVNEAIAHLKVTRSWLRLRTGV